MRKRELRAGIAAGMLWLWWMIISLDPPMLRFFVQNMNMMMTPLRLEIFGPPAATVILILGLLMNQKVIVGSGCLIMIGLDVWRFSQIPRVSNLALALTGSRGLVMLSCLAEALCFLVMLLLIGSPEKPGARILAASVLASAGQISSAIGPGHFRMLGNSGLIVPGVIIYVMAVAATGMYCAGLKPEMLNALFGNSRAAGSPESGYRNSTSTRREGASGKEDIWKDRGAASEEKRDRIRKLKDLRDNGIMTREEYNRMVDKIMRS